jgi:transglutaminase-like putative cysteine protease
MAKGWLLALFSVSLGTPLLLGLARPREAHSLPRAAQKDLAVRLHEGKTWTITYLHTVKNLSSMPMEGVEIAVAVPRDDERQTVHSVQFEPKPLRLSSNGLEQDTALFSLQRVPPQGEATVAITASVTLREVEWLITERDVGSWKEIPVDVLRQYLRDGENYHLDREIVRRSARSLHLTGESILEQVRRVHDFVLDSMEYDRDDRWEPADRVLERGKGSCSEYSYLMIAMCRLNGIPARYAGGTWLQGTALPGAGSARTSPGHGPSEVDHVFHRWVEVYLPRVGWFPIDPTQDDAAERDGEPYRYFGKLPWSYFAMAKGDGDPLESGLLGWEYRSSMRWRFAAKFPKGSVLVDRRAIWKPAPGAAPAVARAIKAKSVD